MNYKLNGFTMIEMLITLTIISLLALLLVPSMHHVIKKREINEFFHVLDRDIFSIQHRALGSRQHERIIFRANDYVIVNHDHRIIARRPYPDSLENVTQSNVRIQFNNKGTVLNPTTYLFQSGETTYEVTFPLGKGRHYIETR